ncbi:unnamed protein product [Adineta steineri]|uniref:Uncharacterized protein n=1 Tax=Adineta steineri TaxID=433720 RepID=A0A819D2E4_9BILA|nr:unnamed protein product [Adineta steineri]CAF3636826.1 unnamed protein product [Adineta steineri]CAF3828269.1 unnamed protein product [Adineta steineri]
MALFFVGYFIAVTSTIAFIVAILTPRWIYPNILPVSNNTPSSPNNNYYLGIFYVDYGFPNGTCRNWILLYQDSVAACRPTYAIACASLAIAGASLSVILLWLAGGYLYVRRRRLVPSFVSIIALLTLLIFWISVVIWIVMITMNRDENLKIRRENIGFSTWIAVGASGGYLLAFIAFVLYRLLLRRRRYVKGTDPNSRRF